MTWRYEKELLANSRNFETFFNVFLFFNFAILIVILLDVLIALECDAYCGLPALLNCNFVELIWL